MASQKRTAVEPAPQAKRACVGVEMLSASAAKAVEGFTLAGIRTHDVRFPTGDGNHGSDAVHTDPDYSAAYCVLTFAGPEGRTLEARGFTFTLGRGNDIVCDTIRQLFGVVKGDSLAGILADIVGFGRRLYNESQLRWLGPEKGVVQIACGGLTNAVWDLWSKLEKKPVWKLVSDMTTEQLVHCIDFKYITDVVSQAEAADLIATARLGAEAREKDVVARGFPIYTTSVGWLGYSDDTIRTLAKKYLADGFTSFKMKVGRDLEDDKRRAAIIREEIGWENRLAMDANQVWDVKQAVSHMKELAEFKPYWIEEPTSPDDVMGHAVIAKALNPMGISVATGEVCHNKVMFKQFMQSGGMQICQIDSCRMSGISEVLAVILLAKKFDVKIVSHSGGVGLFEYVRHLQLIDFVVFGSGGLPLDERLCEWTSHLHEHFVDESGGSVKDARFEVPLVPGYGELKEASIKEYEKTPSKSL